MDMALSPSASTTDGNITTSLVPTYWDTLPDAIVDTITFGTPIGSARIAGVAIEVPPEPPTDIMPSNLPCAYSSGISFSAPRLMTSVAKARSLLELISSMLTPTDAATSAFDTSGANRGSKAPVCMHSVSSPCSRTSFLINSNSVPLVSNVPIIAIVFIQQPPSL